MDNPDQLVTIRVSVRRVVFRAITIMRLLTDADPETRKESRDAISERKFISEIVECKTIEMLKDRLGKTLNDIWLGQ